MPALRVKADFSPRGDQAQAIKALAEGLKRGDKVQCLQGVTGSGKTFTMAKVIEEVGRPTLILSHNKTLAAQLYREFKEFFPDNAVEYFVSYYDYYQPEAYVPARDLYIEKDASINDEIDRLRLAATSSLMDRQDVIIIATVSCIYGLGNPDSFKDMRLSLKRGAQSSMRAISDQLVRLQYQRNDDVPARGRYRIRGDIMEIYPAYAETGIRVSLEWDEIEAIERFDVMTGALIELLDEIYVYPAKHFVLPEEQVKQALEGLRTEALERYDYFMGIGKVVEAERIKTRTFYDLEMLAEVGYCSGIENYSRPLSGRQAGERPKVLLDYFPDDFICFIDESHVTLPQVGAMYEGDRSRKENLVNFGFRLPSAMDNRPLKLAEFDAVLGQRVYVSATPGERELKEASQVVEQVIRPTGLLDPEIFVRPSLGQMEDLYSEIIARTDKGERVLITTLTKKMAEDLTSFLANQSIKVRYIHSDIDTIERVEILRDLRLGVFDVLVGINLLREGLDLPEVSLVAILDADKIGFLRSTRSLIQTIGRAARNANGCVIMYADRYSEAMEEAIAETSRRRELQIAYNEAHGITPQTIIKEIHDLIEREKTAKREGVQMDLSLRSTRYNLLVPKERKAYIRELEAEMTQQAIDLNFEAAAELRDTIARLKRGEMS